MFHCILKMDIRLSHVHTERKARTTHVHQSTVNGLQDTMPTCMRNSTHQYTVFCVHGRFQLHATPYTDACTLRVRILNIYSTCLISIICSFLGLLFLPHIRATEMWIITVAPEAILQREKHISAEINIPPLGVEFEYWNV